MIVTGAPVEQMEFEEVDYWNELTEIMDWTESHVTSTIFLCWAAQASLYHFYGLQKRQLDHKMFGLFWHKVLNRKIPLVRGFDDAFLAPHSRHTEVPIEDIRACKDITILAESEEAGLFLAMAQGGRKIFVMGHPEYDRVTLDGEYKRDVGKGLQIDLPKNYYKDNDPENRPLLLWRAHANNLYTNWLNYYVYRLPPAECLRKMKLLFLRQELGKGEYAEIRIKKNAVVEIVSVHVNGQEKDWDTEGEIVRVHDLVNDINLLEIAAMIPADFTWTGEKKNVILTYNVF